VSNRLVDTARLARSARFPVSFTGQDSLNGQIGKPSVEPALYVFADVRSTIEGSMLIYLGSTSRLMLPKGNNGQLWDVSNAQPTVSGRTYPIFQAINEALAIGIPPQAGNCVLRIGTRAGTLPAWFWHPGRLGQGVVAHLPNLYPVMRRHCNKRPIRAHR